MIKFFEEKDRFGEASIRGDKEWIQFDAGYDDVCLDGTFTIGDLYQVIGEMERHLTQRAVDRLWRRWAQAFSKLKLWFAELSR